MMNKDQKVDTKNVLGTLKKYGVLDYVACWFKKAADYMKGSTINSAFVSTNSICQGEQAIALWQYLFSKEISINFAYQTFVWSNEAKHQANVFCVIIGFSYQKSEINILYNQQGKIINCRNINAYLLNENNFFIKSRKRPICDVPRMHNGCKFLDDGNYVLSKKEKEKVISEKLVDESLIHPYLGARLFLHNIPTYCLWFKDASPKLILKSKFALNRIQNVKEFRSKQKSPDTRKYANRPLLPTRLAYYSNDEHSDMLIVPITTSQRRQYVPIGYVNKDYIVSYSLMLIPNATNYNFGILESGVHNCWIAQVAGRLKSDYRYSNTMVYNTFVWPDIDGKQKENISKTAQAILDARKLYPDSSLADLYDPLTMPAELRKAHEANDKAVLQAYGLKPSASESEIVQHLFKLYEELTRKDKRNHE